MTQPKPRERLYTELPASIMKMLDEMCEDRYSRTAMVTQCIEERYYRLVAEKRVKLASDAATRNQVASGARPRGAGEPIERVAIPPEHEAFFDVYGRLPEPGETLETTTATRPWGKAKP